MVILSPSHVPAYQLVSFCQLCEDDFQPLSEIAPFHLNQQSGKQTSDQNADFKCRCRQTVNTYSQTWFRGFSARFTLCSSAGLPRGESLTKPSCARKHRRASGPRRRILRQQVTLVVSAVTLHRLFSLRPRDTVFLESFCDCHWDILKITQTRGRQMDGREAQSAKDFVYKP